MEGLSLGVKQINLNSKSVLPPIGSARSEKSRQKTSTSTTTSSNKPETSPRVGSKVNGGIERKSSTDRGKSVVKNNSSQSSAPSKGKAPTKMYRPKKWSPEAENAYRFQAAGFRDQFEYEDTYPQPEVWEETGFVRQLQHKTTGYYMYFRQARECEDKYLGKTKIYTY